MLASIRPGEFGTSTERKEGPSFCEQKEAKKLHSMAPGPGTAIPGCFRAQTNKSLFASFSSEKEDPCFPVGAAKHPR
jgi:hypothetical protein